MVLLFSVTKSCLTLCDLMDCSTPCLSVPHHLPEFAQVHVHWISDAIQPSHPLPPSSPFAFNLSQHQGLFQWVCCSNQVAKVLVIRPLFCSTIHDKMSSLVGYHVKWDSKSVDQSFHKVPDSGASLWARNQIKSHQEKCVFLWEGTGGAPKMREPQWSQLATNWPVCLLREHAISRGQH